ncbi:hypothetical protein ABZ848_29790 [Streptomyces sp. NPDC047081]|uniref:Rv1733c family protein n=1 Tax=Streptomyces sp. NPDC047081 TaxID=3154706 RepID=UPI0033C34668
MTRTRATRVKKVPLWRWRHNPLRRRSDRVEAWIVLAAWLVALVGGLLAGLAADAGMADSLAARRASVHSVSAVLTRDAPRGPTVTTAGGSGDTVWAKVHWRAADGSTHTGMARVATGSAAGASVTVWVDNHERLVTSPPSPLEARLQSALAGVLVVFGTAAAAAGCACLARFRLDRRRIRAWEAEWERVGPQWRKKMNG